MYLVPGGCTWSRGVPGPGGYLVPGGCTWSGGGVPGPGGGVYLVQGGHGPGPGGLYLARGGTWSGTPPPVNRMTNRCKNITLPQTSFAGGKNVFLQQKNRFP